MIKVLKKENFKGLKAKFATAENPITIFNKFFKEYGTMGLYLEYTDTDAISILLYVHGEILIVYETNLFTRTNTKEDLLLYLSYITEEDLCFDDISLKKIMECDPGSNDIVDLYKFNKSPIKIEDLKPVYHEFEMVFLENSYKIRLFPYYWGNLFHPDLVGNYNESEKYYILTIFNLILSYDNGKSKISDNRAE